MDRKVRQALLDAVSQFSGHEHTRSSAPWDVHFHGASFSGSLLMAVRFSTIAQHPACYSQRRIAVMDEIIRAELRKNGFNSRLELVEGPQEGSRRREANWHYRFVA